MESAWCRFGKILGSLHKHLAPKRGEPLETVGALKKSGYPALRRTDVFIGDLSPMAFLPRYYRCGCLLDCPSKQKRNSIRPLIRLHGGETGRRPAARPHPRFQKRKRLGECRDGKWKTFVGRPRILSHGQTDTAALLKTGQAIKMRHAAVQGVGGFGSETETLSVCAIKGVSQSGSERELPKPQ